MALELSSSSAAQPACDTPMFVYGVLRDQELLELVAGEAVQEMRPAAMPQRRAEQALGESFPILLDDPAQTAEGALVVGLSAQAKARLDFYEGADYVLKHGLVRMLSGDAIEALCYAPTSRLKGSGRAWSFQEWTRRDKALALECAHEHMSYFGKVSAIEAAAWWPEITARAQKRLGLRNPSIRSDRSRADVREIRTVEAYRKFFAVDERYVAHKRYDGSDSGEIERGLFLSGPGAMVLPYDVTLDKIALIEQWRVGGWVEGDQNPWAIEVIAGRIDTEETPEQVVRREAVEEGGITLGRVEAFGAYLTSPGICDERLNYFVGEADLSAAGGVHGLVEETEDIRLVVISFKDAMAALERGDVNTAPAVLSLLWLARNRERLRAQWS